MGNIKSLFYTIWLDNNLPFSVSIRMKSFITLDLIICANLTLMLFTMTVRQLIPSNITILLPLQRTWAGPWHTRRTKVLQVC